MAGDGPVSVLDMLGSVAGGVGSVISATVAIIASAVAVKMYRRDRLRDTQDKDRALAEAEVGRRSQAELVGVWLEFDCEPDESPTNGQIWIANRSDAPIHDILCRVGAGGNGAIYLLPGLGPQSTGYFDARDRDGRFCRQYVIGFRDRHGTRWRLNESGELVVFDPDSVPMPGPAETRRILNTLMAGEGGSA